jgi:hypothetical protein
MFQKKNAYSNFILNRIHFRFWTAETHIQHAID